MRIKRGLIKLNLGNLLHLTHLHNLVHLHHRHMIPEYIAHSHTLPLLRHIRLVQNLGGLVDVYRI